MADQEKYENLPITRNLLANSASEHDLTPDHSLSSRYGESLPSMNIHNEKITQIGSNLSRFPDDLANLNDSNLDRTSPITASTTSAEQSNIGNDEHPSENTNNEPEKSEETNDLSRSDDAWNEHEKQQQKQEEENNEILPKDEKPDENIDITPVHPADPPSISITGVYVREFLPTSADDPIFSILRDLFDRSFDEFYKQIETQLHLQSEKSLLQWLDETFDKEEQEILAKQYRCFLLCRNENDDSKEIILGFLTLKEEEEGSIYITQIAICLEFKRRGYGTQLLQYLRNIYPPNTQYWGLCRQANQPALQFLLKQGARYIKNDEIATKYDYDPSFYAGFEFVDTIPVIGSENPPLEQLKLNAEHSDELSTTITDEATNNENLPATDDDQLASNSPKKNSKKVVGCCNVV